MPDQNSKETVHYPNTCKLLTHPYYLTTPPVYTFKSLWVKVLLFYRVVAFTFSECCQLSENVYGIG